MTENLTREKEIVNQAVTCAGKKETQDHLYIEINAEGTLTEMINSAGDRIPVSH